ncbi:hypothetical protein [Marinobacter confluentis]|nr:hypothetical protein [Marinobacter confluentis]
MSVRFKLSLVVFALAAGLLSSPATLASDDLDVTMRMVTDDEALTDSVVREIRLDQPIVLEEGPGASGSGKGSERANETARQAREQGRAFGQAAAERAKEAARVREDARGNGSTNRPEVPGSGSGPLNPGNSGGGPD